MSLGFAGLSSYPRTSPRPPQAESSWRWQTGRAWFGVSFGDQSAMVPVRVTRSTWVRSSGLHTDVVPLFSKAGCNMGACHGNLNGKGGFRLSLRGDDPAFDHASLSRDASGRRLNLIAPERSLVLLKPTGLVPHEGGRRFAPDSVEARALCDWIRGGARDEKESAPRVRLVAGVPGRTDFDPGLFRAAARHHG